MQEQWDNAHLCGGSVYVEGHCEYLISHKDVKELQKQEEPKPAAPPKIESVADDNFEDDLGDDIG